MLTVAGYRFQVFDIVVTSFLAVCERVGIVANDVVSASALILVRQDYASYAVSDIRCPVLWYSAFRFEFKGRVTSIVGIAFVVAYASDDSRLVETLCMGQERMLEVVFNRVLLCLHAGVVIEDGRDLLLDGNSLRFAVGLLRLYVWVYRDFLYLVFV